MIFVTQVTAKRRHLLDRPEAVETLCEAWRRSERWRVGRYVILPDHLHFFCAPAIWPPEPLKTWMFYWRRWASQARPWSEERPVWQKDFFDRQLRHGEHYDEKWHYLRQNPVRAGLVDEPDQWPWQGVIWDLRWDG